MDDVFVDPEELNKVDRYWRALTQLYRENKIYTHNWTLFRKWDHDMRIWWIERIEKEAQSGANTIGARLVIRVVANRLDN